MPDRTYPAVRRVSGAEEELEYWTRLNDIVGLRVRGDLTNEEIAERLGVSTAYVDKAVSWAAKNQREAVQDRFAAKFELHERRLEALYAEVQKALDSMATSGLFRPELVKCAIMVMERQSKLWDLDRMRRGTLGAGGQPGKNQDWLDNATWTELAAEARRLGLNVPDPMDLEAQAANAV